jgi:hypothetical protein
MDYDDYRRKRVKANSGSATPYDVLCWQTLKSYQENGFLKVTQPNSARKLRYRYIVGRDELDTIKTRARNIVDAYNNETLRKIVWNGYRAWKRFGLELKRHFKSADPVFAKALEATEQGISKIENKNEPINPKQLLERYIAKLWVGLCIREYYASNISYSKDRFMIFDTPEYSEASKILIDNNVVSKDCFAIPDESPKKNEEDIKSLLDIDNDHPLLAHDIEMLNDSVDYIRQRLQSGDTKKSIDDFIQKEVKSARKKLSWKAVKSTSVEWKVWQNMAAAAVGSSVDSIVPLVFSLLSTCAAISQSRESIKSELYDYCPPARLIVSRSILRKTNLSQSFRTMWLRHMYNLSRNFTPAQVTSYEIQRQLMEPWAQNSVWYHTVDQ